MLLKKSKNSDTRVLALEGVRGIAAILVVVFHVLISFFPAVYYAPDMGNFSSTGFEKLFFGTPLYALINGRFAVAIFFILSGFVLSIGYFMAKTKNVADTKNANQALKRYWRLMIPALASVMIAWLVLVLGLNYNQQAHDITGSLRLGSFWTFDPNFFGALYQGLIGIFKGQDWYNQPLWTMQWEFLGSIMVFVLLWLFGSNKFRYFLYIVGLIGLAHSYVLGFLIGVIIADLYARNKLPTLKTWQGVLLVLVGLLFAAVNSYSSTGLSGWLLRIDDWAFLWYFAGATVIIFACLRVERFATVLAKKRMVAIGKNTFSLYLLHDILLLTLMSFVFVRLQPTLGYVPAFIVALVCFVAILVPATLLFTRYIDEFAIKVSRKFASKVVKSKNDQA